jgi:TPR repeat protein
VSYRVQCSPSLDIFSEFLADLEGRPVHITASNCQDLLALSAKAASIESGPGVGVDLITAARSYGLSAGQDTSRGQWHYGVSLESGSGVGFDLREAAKYYY